MLRLLAVCGLLTITFSLNIGGNDESTYESALKEQGFSKEDVELFIQEYRDAHESQEVSDEEAAASVYWHVTRGYVECEMFKKKEYGYHGKRDCTGCLKPKLFSEICAEYECPPMEGVGITGCGFVARRMLGANWAVTSIDTSDKERGQTEAYWRLFRYINKGNNQGARIAKSAYVITRWFLNDEFQVESGQMALYIPSAFQAKPPSPADDKVTVEAWGDAVLYNRAFGGDITNNPEAIDKHFNHLWKALEKENIASYPKMKITFEYMKPGCGSQRTEVMLTADSFK